MRTEILFWLIRESYINVPEIFHEDENSLNKVKSLKFFNYSNTNTQKIIILTIRESWLIIAKNCLSVFLWKFMLFVQPIKSVPFKNEFYKSTRPDVSKYPAGCFHFQKTSGRGFKTFGQVLQNTQPDVLKYPTGCFHDLICGPGTCKLMTRLSETSYWVFWSYSTKVLSKQTSGRMLKMSGQEEKRPGGLF